MKLNLGKMQKLRKKNNLSIRDVSEILGFKTTQGYFYKENGRSKITAEELKILADLYGVPMESLFINY